MTIIRPAKVSDAVKIAELMEQLGYIASPALLANKIAVLGGSPCDLVLVAEHNETLVGVISLHITELFHAYGSIGRITTLVVASNRHGEGIGKLLIDAADKFFISAGCVRAEVTSGNHRAKAHAFYENNGYIPDERRFMKSYDQTAKPQ